MRKREVFNLVFAFWVIILTVAGAFYAYFVDIAQAKNEFTAGTVDIKLNYSGREADQVLLDIGSISTYPGQTVNINAKITNVGSEEAYVGAVISLSKKSDLKTLIPPALLDDILVGLAVDGSTVKYAVTDVGYELYVIKSASISKDANACVFTGLRIPEDWDNEQMNTFNGMVLHVKAYATQKAGFDSAEEAIITAFDAAWATYKSATALTE